MGDNISKESKKNLKDQYKNMSEIGGVYFIICGTKKWIKSAVNIQGAKNRFEFSVKTDMCPEPSMIKFWKQFGPSSFKFEILEEIKKKETQTNLEFSEDVDTLLEIWKEKIESE